MKTFKLAPNHYVYIILAALVLITFGQALGFFFTRDDFGFFPRADFAPWDPRIIAPYVGWFYRPVSQQIFFYLGYQAFGLNAFGYHLVNVVFHLFNSILLYLIILRFTKNKIASLVGVSFFAVSRIHLMSVYWISAFTEVGAAFFYFLTFLLFLKYLDHKKLVYLILSLPVFFLGLFSKEMLVTIPLVTCLYLLIFNNFKKTRSWFIANSKILLPYFLMTGAFLIFYKKFVILPTGPYSLNFNPLTAAKTAFRYYFGIFATSYDQVHKISLLNFLLALRLGVFLVAVALVVKKYFAKKKSLDLKIYIFGLSWLFLATLPVLFIPDHAFPYYMTIPMLGLCLIVAQMFADITPKLTRPVTLFLAALLVVLNLATGAIDQQASNYLTWVRDLQAGARVASNSLKNVHFQTNETVFMTPSTEKSQATLFWGELIRDQHINQNLKVKFLEKTSLNLPPPNYMILRFNNDSSLTDVTGDYQK